MVLSNWLDTILEAWNCKGVALKLPNLIVMNSFQ